MDCFIISGTPKAWNALIGKRWAYYNYAKEIKEQIFYTPAFRALPKGIKKVRIIIDVGYTTKRRNDICDLCTKPHIDALVDAGVIEDDNRQIVREFSVIWHESKTAETVVLIDPID